MYSLEILTCHLVWGRHIVADNRATNCLHWIPHFEAMGDENLNLILLDLQKQLKTAKIPVENLPVIARKGDESVSWETGSALRFTCNQS